MTVIRLRSGVAALIGRLGKRLDRPVSPPKVKMNHAQINTGLKRWMVRREDGLDKTFLNRSVQDGVGPWGKTNR
jgi:hypothetical protein